MYYTYIRNLLFVSFPERKIHVIFISTCFSISRFTINASCLENAAPARSPILLITGGFLQEVANRLGDNERLDCMVKYCKAKGEESLLLLCDEFLACNIMHPARLWRAQFFPVNLIRTVEFFFFSQPPAKKTEPSPNHTLPSKNSRQGHVKRVSPRPSPTLTTIHPKLYRSIGLDTVNTSVNWKLTFHEY